MIIEMEHNNYKLDAMQIKFAGGSHTAKKWAGLVIAYRDILQSNNAKTWLLYEPDSFTFSALFYALLVAGKSIVLPQNCQHEHIQSVKKLTQASIGNSQVDPDILVHHGWPERNDCKLSVPADSEICFLTSGSTGQAKIIRKNFSQLQIEINALEDMFCGQVTDSVFISTVSHQHIYGLLFRLLWPLTKGHAVICQAFEYPEHIVNAVQLEQINQVTLIASPAHLQRLCLDNVLVNVKENISFIFSSGGPLDAENNMQLKQQLGCTLTEVYGSTETGGIAWRERASLDDDVWQTFTDISVTYQNNSDLLQLSSPYILQDDFLADDRVNIISSTRFRLLGRADSIVKIEEKRVSLDEVKTRLKQHQYVNDAYVLVVGSSRKQLAAVIVLNAKGIEAKNNLSNHLVNNLFKRFLAQWFEPVVLPKKFRYPSELPYNAQGKLSRRDLEVSFE
jgi:acyl-coenzyme A synthetase/AMP-(fatty) acid ligase